MGGYTPMTAGGNIGQAVVFNSSTAPPLPGAGGGLSGLGFGDKAMGHLGGAQQPRAAVGIRNSAPPRHENLGLDAVVAQLQASDVQNSTPSMGQPAAGGWGMGT